MKIQYRNNLLAFLIPSILIGASACSPKINSRKAVDHSEQQTRMMLTEISKAENKKGDLVSPRTIENSQLKLVSSKDWTSGFFRVNFVQQLMQTKGLFSTIAPAIGQTTAKYADYYYMEALIRAKRLKDKQPVVQ